MTLAPALTWGCSALIYVDFTARRSHPAHAAVRGHFRLSPCLKAVIAPHWSQLNWPRGLRDTARPSRYGFRPNTVCTRLALRAVNSGVRAPQSSLWFSDSTRLVRGGHTNIVERHRHFAAHPNEALKRLLAAPT